MLTVRLVGARYFASCKLSDLPDKTMVEKPLAAYGLSPEPPPRPTRARKLRKGEAA